MSAFICSKTRVLACVALASVLVCTHQELLGAGTINTELPSPTRRTVNFSTEVQPILERSCLKCHGPETHKSGFQLTTRAAALKGGERGVDILPGQSEKSPLIRFVAHMVEDMEMPPPGKGAPLNSEQIGLLRAWIDQGAPWPENLALAISDSSPTVEAPPAVANKNSVKGTPTRDIWAFKPPQRPSLPHVRHGSWVRNPIDRFILARLDEVELAPTPEADRATLIRRLYFVLLGMPPTPEEIAAFLNDQSPTAYEALVDRLLASPHYGECWARHWLDVVRFAESNGFETNTERPNSWPYRDYVIRAFNDDKPFDRFITEQLAGDALGADEATGFLVGGPYDAVKSPDLNLTLQQRMDELHDMVSTTGSAFLGLTVGCARCHNHKFDPISQADYYSIQAIFAGVQHGERSVRALDQQRSLGRSGESRMLYAGHFEQPGATYRLQRGEPLQKREQVAPGAVHGIGWELKLPPETPEQERRLALAHWITDSSNPLTARVLVNRLWQYQFGQGIVSTPSDFGQMGAQPTHPELLDWLAVEFRESGWRIKHIQRLIVLSATFRQASTANPDALRKDADARLLWRFPPRRVEAESLRDAILATSGALDLRMFGRGFDLFQPNNNYVKVYNPKTEFGPAEWRRMVYQSKPRMRLDDTFGTFDCPDAGQVAPRRTVSTTPLQVLSLLNSPFMLQQSELFAHRLQSEAGPELSLQVERAFVLALGRRPSDAERAAGFQLAHDYGLKLLCRGLFNANEFLYVF
jgi:hypothetical protein